MTAATRKLRGHTSAVQSNAPKCAAAPEGSSVAQRQHRWELASSHGAGALRAFGRSSETHRRALRHLLTSKAEPAGHAMAVG